MRWRGTTRSVPRAGFDAAVAGVAELEAVADVELAELLEEVDTAACAGFSDWPVIRAWNTASSLACTSVTRLRPFELGIAPQRARPFDPRREFLGRGLRVAGEVGGRADRDVFLVAQRELHVGGDRRGGLLRALARLWWSRCGRPRAHRAPSRRRRRRRTRVPRAPTRACARHSALGCAAQARRCVRPSRVRRQRSRRCRAAAAPPVARQRLRARGRS